MAGPRRAAWPEPAGWHARGAPAATARGLKPASEYLSWGNHVFLGAPADSRCVFGGRLSRKRNKFPFLRPERSGGSASARGRHSRWPDADGVSDGALVWDGHFSTLKQASLKFAPAVPCGRASYRGRATWAPTLSQSRGNLCGRK